jgi:beta-lactamase regulating signal transducer with metallopeptidase domain
VSAIFLRTLVESSVRVTFLAMATAAVLATVRVRGAAARHAAWTAVLVAMLLMPALLFLVPNVTIAVPVRSARMNSVAIERGDERSTLMDYQRRTAAPASQGRRDAIQRRRSEVPLQSGRGFGPSPFLQLVLVLAAYLSGVAMSLARCVVGWRRAARLVRDARPITVPWEMAVEVRATYAIVVPVTVGFGSPTILLPVDWRRWPAGKLRAVLAHELAHVQRRDPAINVLAQVNRAIFWFHPLAWWLSHTLATAAELASDDVAVRVVGDKQRYAEVLVHMARAVAASGGLLSLAGPRRELIGRRVDRILDNEGPREPSKPRKVLVVAGCAATLVAAIACQPRFAPLKDDAQASVEERDRTLRAELSGLTRMRYDFGVPDDAIGPKQIGELEGAVGEDPEYLSARHQLLLYYWTNPNLLRRRSHILWIIEHHPESRMAGSILTRLSPNDLEQSFPGDPTGYEQARALWLAQTDRPMASPAILGNASFFFEGSDQPLAEALLLRARAADPQGPWSARLGRFYALVLGGLSAQVSRSRIRAVSLASPTSSIGIGVRQKLGESTDDVLLTAAGWFLLGSVRGLERPFDLDYWAEACFRRSLRLNPRGVLAHTLLLDMSRHRNRGEPLWPEPPMLQYASISALPEGERFEQLPDLARRAYATLEDLSRWNDPNLQDRRDLARQQAEDYARDALHLSPKYRGHPRYGTAIYNANITLGALALRDGDRHTAVEFLRRASEAPSSEELVYGDDVVVGPHWNLAGQLLERGERQAVIEFSERMAAINIPLRKELADAAIAIRRGEMPAIYRIRGTRVD